MKTLYQGKVLDVLVAPEAWEAWREARSKVPGNQGQCEAQLIARLKLLADRGELPIPKAMSKEGDGIQAVKAHCGLRAYGWFTSGATGKKVFAIGHAVLKKQNRARKQDLERTKAVRQEQSGG